MDKPQLIAVGKVVRTHGVRGSVKIYPYGETLAQMGAGEELILQSESVDRRLTLVSVRPQKNLLVAQFAELKGVDEAEAVIGREVAIPEDRLPPTEEDEYYHYQLIGLRVETREGLALGPLRAIIPTGGNDVYVVEYEGKEVLIPAIEDVICEVDTERGVMVVDLPEGLLDAF